MMTEDGIVIPDGKGVRALTIEDQLPDCTIVINGPMYVYDLHDIARGKRVLDIGCGYGANRAIVEGVGGSWVGLEPFEGGAHTVVGRAEDLPFEEASFDIVVMNAVLEHVEDAGAAFAEIARVLRPGGAFVGYSAFMECFHEISYSHLSHKALEFYAKKNGLILETIGGGRAFGIDYHIAVLLYPLPMKLMRRLIAKTIRMIFRTKAALAYVALRLRRKLSDAQARAKARDYYRLECLRQSNGFTFIIRKPAAG